VNKLDQIGSTIVDTAFKLHQDLGPGLLETVYEQVLAAKLQQIGLSVVRQQPIDIVYETLEFKGAFRADLVVESCVLIEIKSVERLAAIHAKQVITYLRLTDIPLGFLINFGGAMLKDNIRRLANSTATLASSRLGASTSLA
jgi:GxxExxY protein